MRDRSTRYPREFREEAARLYRDTGRSQRAIASELGVSTETMRRWVKQTNIDEKRRPGLTTTEREELRRLRRENLVLRQERDILKKRRPSSRGRSSASAGELLSVDPRGEGHQRREDDVPGRRGLPLNRTSVKVGSALPRLMAALRRRRAPQRGPNRRPARGRRRPVRGVGDQEQGPQASGLVHGDRLAPRGHGDPRCPGRLLPRPQAKRPLRELASGVVDGRVDQRPRRGSGHLRVPVRAAGRAQRGVGAPCTGRCPRSARCSDATTFESQPFSDERASSIRVLGNRRSSASFITVRTGTLGLDLQIRRRSGAVRVVCAMPRGPATRSGAALVTRGPGCLSHARRRREPLRFEGGR